jgi:hypothetical protein
VIRLDEASPRAKARITGAVYLIFFAAAIAGEVFDRQAGVSATQSHTSGNEATMVNTMLVHIASLRWGSALGLISIACYIAVTVLLYQLLKPGSPSLALIAMCLSLMGLAVQTYGAVFQLAPLTVLSDGANVSVFDASQVRALAVSFLHLRTLASQIGLVFDGLFLLLIGYLIIRSTFLPVILGALTALAGLGWLSYLAPPLANQLQPYVQILGFIAEAALMLWLLVVGVSVPTRRGSRIQGDVAPIGD